jgi:hypothetical protein
MRSFYAMFFRNSSGTDKVLLYNSSFFYLRFIFHGLFNVAVNSSDDIVSDIRIISK